MGLLEQDDLARLRVARMIFHVVGPEEGDLVLMDEVDVGAVGGFFLERIRETNIGNRFEFIGPEQGVRPSLTRIVNQPDGFVEVSKHLAQSFHGAHANVASKRGAFIVAEMRGLEAPVFALIKFDDLRVLRFLQQMTPEGALKATVSETARIDGKLRMSAIVEAPNEALWNDGALYGLLNETCIWIFSEPREASNKHSLLVSELSRSWPEAASWGSGLSLILEDCLTSAQVAYRLHLQEKGVDALKLMADLRKAVSEDVKSVAAQVSALSLALWRDAAVALGAIALRNAGTVTDLVTYLVAIYLSLGGYLTLRLANRAVEAIADNELAFRRALYKPLLTDSTYEQLALSRYEEVFREYVNYRRIIFCVYLIAILGILALVGVPLFLEDAGGVLTLVNKLRSQ